jgi:hypothetical protein
MEMAIHSYGAGSVVAQGVNLIPLTDADFVARSAAFADALAQAQSSRQIPGGICAVFDGEVGFPATPFFGIMKAELQDGFNKKANLQVDFLNSLFLTPKQKLYKIAVFVSDDVQPSSALPAGWTATLYDSQLTASQRDGAATYFHSTFLGLSIPQNNAQQVKAFYEKTTDFIRNSNLPEEAKVDLFNGLYTYLKVDQSPTIQVPAFAQTYMPPAVAADYTAHMAREKFPTRAIQKDISEVAGRLKIRRLRFRDNIQLSGPPQAIKDLVTVETIQNPNGHETWTRLTIRAPIQTQE